MQHRRIWLELLRVPVLVAALAAFACAGAARVAHTFPAHNVPPDFCNRLEDAAESSGFSVTQGYVCAVLTAATGERVLVMINEDNTVTVDASAAVPIATRARAENLVRSVLGVPEYCRKATVAVIGVATANPDVARALTEVAVQKLATYEGFKVWGPLEVEAVIGLEKQKDLVGCDDTVCLTSIAGALNVDALLLASASVVAETYVVSVKILDARNLAVLGRAMRKTSEGELLSVVEGAVAEVAERLCASSS